MDLLTSDVVALEHLRNAATGACPAVAVCKATFGAWTVWRRVEARREAAQRARFLASLKAADLSEADYASLQAQLKAYVASTQERGAMLADLMAQAAEGAEVQDQIQAINADAAAAADQWRDAVATQQRWLDAWLRDDTRAETLEDVRHTFELVLHCIQRVDGVTAGGKPVIWDDKALQELGMTKSMLLERLLGTGDQAFEALYRLADVATHGLTEGEKKA